MPETIDSKFDLAANTYTAKEQSFALVEIGDSKQPDVFLPQVKIMRWDNEVNFSVRLVNNEAAPVTALVDDKIQWVGNGIEAHFYEIGDGKEGGGFEFELILKEPPKSNVISMAIQTKGLDFFYQPELTQQEIDEGSVRPENVVGSYAVYHKTMAGNYEALGGKNYKVGKAFQIFRPRIEDAKGNWVWGDLNIDENAGLLTVTIPQKFFDSAVYPVRHAAGLEFGYHTAGGTTLNITGNAYHLLAKANTNPEFSGVLTQIVGYMYNQAAANRHFWPAIYDDVAGVPTNRLAALESGGGLLPSDWSTAWVPSDISYSLTANVTYWLGYAAETHNLPLYSKYDSSSGNILAFPTNKTMDAWPANWSNDYYQPWKASIYGIYTPAATGTLLTNPGMNGGLNRPSLRGGLNG